MLNGGILPIGGVASGRACLLGGIWAHTTIHVCTKIVCFFCIFIYSQTTPSIAWLGRIRTPSIAWHDPRCLCELLLALQHCGLQGGQHGLNPPGEDRLQEKAQEMQEMQEYLRDAGVHERRRSTWETLQCPVPELLACPPGAVGPPGGGEGAEGPVAAGPHHCPQCRPNKGPRRHRSLPAKI